MTIMKESRENPARAINAMKAEIIRRKTRLAFRRRGAFNRYPRNKNDA